MNYLIEEYGRAQGMNFLTAILESTNAEGIKQPTLEIIHDAFSKTISGTSKPKSQIKRNFDEALLTQEKYAGTTREFLNRMGIKDNGIMFLNGRLVEFNEEKVCCNSANISKTTKVSVIAVGTFTYARY